MLSKLTYLVTAASVLNMQLTSASPLVNSMVEAKPSEDEQLVFAFELVRHGARAPFDDRKAQFFKVDEGMLTAEGMRQRYLLGRHSRERYTKTYPLLSEEYDPSEFYIQSTNVNRTMQSGYSELMGLYPAGQGDKLSDPMIAMVTPGLPFNVRDADKINQELGSDALPNGASIVPIFVYNNDDINDDVSYDGCPYINEAESARIDDPAVYEDFNWMMAGAREPIKEMYDLTDEYMDSLNYHHFETLTDEAVALDFEG